MKPRELTDSEKLRILELKADGQSYDNIVPEIRSRKSKLIEVIKWFNNLPWEDAKAYCNSNQKVLGLRKDYFERKVAEAKENKERQRAEILEMKRELGLRPTYIDEDGHYVMEL